jgi:hypothetical protein
LPFKVVASSSNLSFQGRIKTMEGTKSSKDGKFRPIKVAATLQAVGTLVYIPFNVASLDLLMRNRILTKSLKRLESYILQSYQ